MTAQRVTRRHRSAGKAGPRRAYRVHFPGHLADIPTLCARSLENIKRINQLASVGHKEGVERWLRRLRQTGGYIAVHSCHFRRCEQ